MFYLAQLQKCPDIDEDAHGDDDKHPGEADPLAHVHNLHHVDNLGIGRYKKALLYFGSKYE